MEPQVHLGPRIVVTGPSGSGKTFLGIELGSQLDRRVFRLDPLVRDERVGRRPPLEIASAMEDVARGDEWILEGSPWDVPQHAWSTATAVIWLDFPRFLRAWRLFKRGFPRWLLRRQMWGGIRYAIMAPAAVADRWQSYVQDKTPATASLIPISTRKGIRDLMRGVVASNIRREGPTDEDR